MINIITLFKYAGYTVIGIIFLALFALCVRWIYDHFKYTYKNVSFFKKNKGNNKVKKELSNSIQTGDILLENQCLKYSKKFSGMADFILIKNNAIFVIKKAFYNKHQTLHPTPDILDIGAHLTDCFYWFTEDKKKKLHKHYSLSRINASVKDKVEEKIFNAGYEMPVFNLTVLINNNPIKYYSEYTLDEIVDLKDLSNKINDLCSRVKNNQSYGYTRLANPEIHNQKLIKKTILKGSKISFLRHKLSLNIFGSAFYVH